MPSGEALRTVVEDLRAKVIGELAAVRAESARINTKMLAKLAAAMEQSRSLKAWREQQNLRILEMQVRAVRQMPLIRSSHCCRHPVSVKA